MKIVVVLMLLGAMVAGSAYAAAVPAETSMSKDRSVQAPSKTKKNKSLHGRKPKASGKAGAAKVDLKAKQKQDGMTETPPESADQSVQLRGVRG